MEGREIGLNRWKDIDVVMRQGHQQHVRRTVMKKLRLIVGVGRRIFVAFRSTGVALLAPISSSYLPASIGAIAGAGLQMVPSVDRARDAAEISGRRRDARA